MSDWKKRPPSELTPSDVEYLRGLVDSSEVQTTHEAFREFCHQLREQDTDPLSQATLAFRAVIVERDGWRRAYNNATAAKNRLSAENRRLRRMLTGIMIGAAVEITALVAGLIWFATRI